MKFPEDFVNKLIVADCLDVLNYIPDYSIDAVITDPPYMISQEVKIFRQRNPRKFDQNRWKYVGSDLVLHFGKWDTFENEEQYFEFTEKWIKECARVLKKGGHLITFFDKFKITTLIKIGEKYNFKARQPLYWIKSNPVPQARKVKFMNSVEMMLWFTKETTSRKYATFNYQLGQHKDYVISPICQGNERYKHGRHPTQKPLKVIEWLLLYLTNENDIVLDPFAGSGTVGVACIKLNRRYVLIEKDENYAEIINRRIKDINGELFNEDVFKQNEGD